MPRSHQQTHQAGRHLAVGQALLDARNARLIGRQTHIEISGHRAAVMVAGKGAWMIENVDKFTDSSIGAYVLVNVASHTPEFYVAPGDELRRDVRERHEQYMARVGTRPRNPESLHTKIEPQDISKWADNWSLFDHL